MFFFVCAEHQPTVFSAHTPIKFLTSRDTYSPFSTAKLPFLAFTANAEFIHRAPRCCCGTEEGNLTEISCPCCWRFEGMPWWLQAGRLPSSTHRQNHHPYLWQPQKWLLFTSSPWLEAMNVNKSTKQVLVKQPLPSSSSWRKTLGPGWRYCGQVGDAGQIMS